MTNEEMFKTAKERFEEFDKFCNNHTCDNCPVGKVGSLESECVFNWLALECENGLKPCPLCGHTDIRMLKNTAGDVWYVSCNGCGCRTGGDVVKDMAIDAWNRRVK